MGDGIFEQHFTGGPRKGAFSWDMAVAKLTMGYGNI